MGLNMSMPKDIISRALSEGRNFLLEPEAKLLCAYYGIPVTKFKIARNLDEAKRFASEIGYPVVLKIVSPDVLHKTDVGAVIVNIKNEEELVRAYNTIMENVKKHKPNARIIVDIMIKVSKMIEENPMISQLDLNPIIVYTKGAKVVDARIILET